MLTRRRYPVRGAAPEPLVQRPTVALAKPASRYNRHERKRIAAWLRDIADEFEAMDDPNAEVRDTDWLEDQLFS